MICMSGAATVGIIKTLQHACCYSSWPILVTKHQYGDMPTDSHRERVSFWCFMYYSKTSVLKVDCASKNVFPVEVGFESNSVGAW